MDHKDASRAGERLNKLECHLIVTVTTQARVSCNASEASHAPCRRLCPYSPVDRPSGGLHQRRHIESGRVAATIDRALLRRSRLNYYLRQSQTMKPESRS